MSIVTIAAIKAKFETGDFPTQQDFIDLIDTLGAGTSYKRYVALLTQSGTAAPTAVVLENTLGQTITFTYTSAGVYHIVSSAAFTTNKTFMMINPSDNVFPALDWANSSDIVLRSYDGSYNGANSLLVAQSIEIRVYL